MVIISGEDGSAWNEIPEDMSVIVDVTKDRDVGLEPRHVRNQ